MKIFDLLIGKKIKVMTDMKVEVELEIKKIKQNNHSEDLEPPTKENDWYPPARYWTTFTVYFTNGAQKRYDSLGQINIIDG